MKRIIFGITITMLIFLITIFVLSLKKNVSATECFYTLPRIMTYNYHKDKEMSFEIFINNQHSLIEFPEKNKYYIEDEKNSFPLTNVRIEKKLDYINKEEVFYKYIVIANLLSFLEENIILKNCKIRIENESYTFLGTLGYLAIYKENYIPLEFYDLYGYYTYIENELHLIGITIQLSTCYKKLHTAHIGPAYVQNSKIEKDHLYESEIPSSKLRHSFVEEETEQNDFSLTARQGYYFLPISYPEISLITYGCILFDIDDKTYYIEDFTYLANEISIQDYKKLSQEGTIVYA
ncbi:MAG: hypothetical protein K2N64_07230 [Anaeroplasmataceae bacterium]|nr:hypothetical protein [Anaeroplasmataceae bacterium]